jgi:hypothetical protein
VAVVEQGLLGLLEQVLFLEAAALGLRLLLQGPLFFTLVAVVLVGMEHR